MEEAEAHIIFDQGKGNEKEIQNLVSKYCESFKIKTKDVLVFFDTDQNAKKTYKNLQLKTKDIKWSLKIVESIYNSKISNNTRITYHFKTNAERNFFKYR